MISPSKQPGRCGSWQALCFTNGYDQRLTYVAHGRELLRLSYAPGKPSARLVEV